MKGGTFAGTRGPTGPAGPTWTRLTPAQIAKDMHDIAAGNILRQTGSTFTWGTRFLATDAKSCVGAAAFWKSAGSSETLTFTYWDEVGTQLGQKTALTSASGIVVVTWDSPIAVNANERHTIGLYVANATTTWSSSVFGFRMGDYSDLGVVYSMIWSITGANTFPTVENSNSPPTKCTVGPIFA